MRCSTAPALQHSTARHSAPVPVPVEAVILDLDSRANLIHLVADMPGKENLLPQHRLHPEPESHNCWAASDHSARNCWVVLAAVLRSYRHSSEAVAAADHYWHSVVVVAVARRIDLAEAAVVLPARRLVAHISGREAVHPAALDRDLASVGWMAAALHTHCLVAVADSLRSHKDAVNPPH